MQTVAAMNVAPVARFGTLPQKVARGSVAARATSPNKNKTPGDALACASIAPGSIMIWAAMIPSLEHDHE